MQSAGYRLRFAASVLVSGHRKSALVNGSSSASERRRNGRQKEAGEDSRKREREREKERGREGGREGGRDSLRSVILTARLAAIIGGLGGCF